MGTQEDHRGHAVSVRQSRTRAHASPRLVGSTVSFPSWKWPRSFTYIGINHKEFLILRFRNSQILAISYTISLMISAHLTLTITTLSFVFYEMKRPRNRARSLRCPRPPSKERAELGLEPRPVVPSQCS